MQKKFAKNIVQKILAEIFLWKEKFSQKKIDAKKKFVEKNVRKKHFSKKKLKKNLKIKKF